MSISYFSEKDNMDVLVGVYPIDPNFKIPRGDFVNKLVLHLREGSSKSLESNGTSRRQTVDKRNKVSKKL